MFNEAPLKVQGYGREAPHRVTYRLNLQARHTHIRPLKGCFLPGFLLSPQGKGQLSSIQTQLTQGPKEKGDFPSLGSRPTTPVLISPPRTSHFLDSWQRIAEPRRRSHASQAKLEAWSRKVSGLQGNGVTIAAGQRLYIWERMGGSRPCSCPGWTLMLPLPHGSLQAEGQPKETSRLPAYPEQTMGWKEVTDCPEIISRTSGGGQKQQPSPSAAFGELISAELVMQPSQAKVC